MQGCVNIKGRMWATASLWFLQTPKEWCTLMQTVHACGPHHANGTQREIVWNIYIYGELCMCSILWKVISISTKYTCGGLLPSCHRSGYHGKHSQYDWFSCFLFWISYEPRKDSDLTIITIITHTHTHIYTGYFINAFIIQVSCYHGDWSTEWLILEDWAAFSISLLLRSRNVWDWPRACQKVTVTVEDTIHSYSLALLQQYQCEDVRTL